MQFMFEIYKSEYFSQRLAKVKWRKRAEDRLV